MNRGLEGLRSYLKRPGDASGGVTSKVKGRDKGYSVDIPRRNQCFLCKGWLLEKDLKSIEVPDQGAGYVRKLACRECPDKIMGKSGVQDEPQQEKNEMEGIRGKG